ncbi:hypothetical protein PAMA111031_03865 [Paraphotobacterium marinum]
MLIPIILFNVLSTLFFTKLYFKPSGRPYYKLIFLFAASWGFCSIIFMLLDFYKIA